MILFRLGGCGALSARGIHARDLVTPTPVARPAHRRITRSRPFFALCTLPPCKCPRGTGTEGGPGAAAGGPSLWERHVAGGRDVRHTRVGELRQLFHRRCFGESSLSSRWANASGLLELRGRFDSYASVGIGVRGGVEEGETSVEDVFCATSAGRGRLLLCKCGRPPAQQAPCQQRIRRLRGPTQHTVFQTGLQPAWLSARPPTVLLEERILRVRPAKGEVERVFARGLLGLLALGLTSGRLDGGYQVVDV